MAFIATLKEVVGRRYVLSSDQATYRYRTGYRYGGGAVLAVVRPGTLIELWRVAKLCTSSRKIIVMQAANTGLTGGSTPYGRYDREVVIISAMRISQVQIIDGGRQVLCFPGTQLNYLERVLKPLGKEPHSVIGSSCIGASVVGGICNNSGGSLVRRGAAFTKLALFARVDEAGTIHLVNHLGIDLGEDPEDCLRRLECGAYESADISPASPEEYDYEARVRDVTANTPARFNNDPQCLHETSGCAGRLIVFAVRLPTYPKDVETRVFYIGTNDPNELTDIRVHVLKNFKSLPISAEYLHADIFDLARDYGKDTFVAIRALGVEKLPYLFALKNTIDQFAAFIGFENRNVSDHVLQFISRLLPQHLPRRLREFRKSYNHHLIIRVGDDGIEEARKYLSCKFPTRTGASFECSQSDGEKAFLHRFAAAGAATRYAALHNSYVEGVISFDIALKRNEQEWVTPLPRHLDEMVDKALIYGHFFCHVFHKDYILRKGSDPQEFKTAMLNWFDQNKIEYPAEHNVGHLYKAKPVLASFYKDLDPSNSINPGIGQTSKLVNWK